MPLTSEVTPVEISSIGELANFVASIASGDRPRRWFRGHRRAHWGVCPFIWRFMARRTNGTSPIRSGHGSITVSQTRLLDWSRSPLIAAYFAVAKYIRKDVTLPTPQSGSSTPHAMNQRFHGSDLTFPIDSNIPREMLEPAF